MVVILAVILPSSMRCPKTFVATIQNSNEATSNFPANLIIAIVPLGGKIVRK